MPLRKSLDDTFVFRKVIGTLLLGYVMSILHVTYSMMSNWIKRVGMLTGWKFNSIPYYVRYNTASELGGRCYPPCI